MMIQSRLKAPKNQYNKFGNYRYRSAEDILEGVKPLLQEVGCHLTISDDVVLVGNRIYIKATATIQNEKGEVVTTTAFAREEEQKKGMDVSQVTGSTSSYARKYALNGLFCIDDTKDADTMDNRERSSENTDMNELLTMAMCDLGNADTADKVATVWRNFPSLQQNEAFKQAVTKKGTQLKQSAV